LNFEKVEEILGNNAPRIQGFVDFSERAGIKFAFASMTEESVITFEDVYKSSAAQAIVSSFLTTIFEDILGRFYTVAQYETLQLWNCYDFDGKGWCYYKGGSDTPDRVKERVQDILGIGKE
jgi:hypothetical protein